MNAVNIAHELGKKCALRRQLHQIRQLFKYFLITWKNRFNWYLIVLTECNIKKHLPIVIDINQIQVFLRVGFLELFNIAIDKILNVPYNGMSVQQRWNKHLGRHTITCTLPRNKSFTNCSIIFSLLLKTSLIISLVRLQSGNTSFSRSFECWTLFV